MIKKLFATKRITVEYHLKNGGDKSNRTDKGDSVTNGDNVWGREEESGHK